jgi:hypothetical protein
LSLLLAGLVFAGTSGALMVGRWIARRRGAPGDEEPKTAGDDDAKAKSAEDEHDAAARKEVEAEVPNRPVEEEHRENERAPKAKEPKRGKEKAPSGERLDGFVCQLGDVVMRLTGEEAWLAGGVVLSEQLPVSVLFVAPDAGHDCLVYVRSRPSQSLVWLEPLDASAILVGGEPPSSLEHGGVRFERVRRLPLRSRRIGVGAPDTGDAVLVAEYSSAGAERLIVMKGNSGRVHAYRGLELEEGSFEVIASGATTLET